MGSSRWLVVLTLTLALGAHWALLQTVAWTGMLITYSRDASFAEAVSKTFDGQHPCRMCKAIQQGRAAEKQQQQKQLKPESKLDLGLVCQPQAFDFSCKQPRIPAFACAALSRRDAPPKPPPRLLAAGFLA